MAILQIGRDIPKYIGASTDTKPTETDPQDLESPQVGSTFHEHDTSSLYITYDKTNWVVKSVGVGHIKTGINHGVNEIASAGTEEELKNTATPAKVVFIQSQTDNTGLIAVGGSGVDATEASGAGVILLPGETVVIETADLQDIYIDATVSGEGVRYTYLT
tara:strand:+ start:4188 stop:4670 length:483 start_codon:yes stop_codon:yes gene_type:complete